MYVDGSGPTYPTQSNPPTPFNFHPPFQGGYGSIGYGCEFQRGEAVKNLLRTHTTAVSARMLYQ